MRSITLIAWAGYLALPASTGGEVVLLYKHGVPQTEFAANEIRIALEAKGDTWVHKELSELKTQGTTRIALAASSEESGILADALGVKPLRQDLPAQSYLGHFSHAGKK